MANTAAIKFLKYLIAAFSRFPISSDTKEFYSAKLQKCRLTQEQWDKALDAIVESRQDEALPTLNEIYKQLKISSYENPARGLKMASAVFDLNGYTRLIRCLARDRNDGSGRIEWVIADVVTHDVHQQEIRWQQHVGEPVLNHIPAEATNFDIFVDDPPMPKPEDMPNKSDVHELVNQTMAKMGGL